MKRILILCDPFAPPAYVPRVRFIAKQLQEQGYEVEICTEALLQGYVLPDLGCDIHTMPYYTKKGWLGKVQWGGKFMAQLVYNDKERQFTRFCKSVIAGKSFDLIFCSCFHTFPLNSAMALSKSLQIPLVVDLRDIEEQCPGTSYYAHQMPSLLGLEKIVPTLYRRINLKRRNRVLQYANAITTVSYWHVDKLQAYNPETHLIYNGYDAELFVPETIKSPQFSICYTGRLYDPIMQDPTLFFEAMSSIVRKEAIDLERLSIDFYTDEHSRQKLLPYISKYDLEKWTHFHDFIPTNQVPHILNESSLLLVFSNLATSQTANGILTTKFYEYLGVEKPVLCVRSDEGQLAKLIELTGIGVAAENRKQAEKFIIKQYRQWENQDYTHVEINPIVKEEYSRQRQTDYLIDLFKKLTK